MPESAHDTRGHDAAHARPLGYAHRDLAALHDVLAKTRRRQLGRRHEEARHA